MKPASVNSWSVAIAAVSRGVLGMMVATAYHVLHNHSRLPFEDLLSNAGAGIEPIERRAVRTTDGTWLVKGLVLPVPELWRVRIDVLISDFEKATLEGAAEVRP